MLLPPAEAGQCSNIVSTIDAGEEGFIQWRYPIPDSKIKMFSGMIP